jgi:hypothetical protein
MTASQLASISPVNPLAKHDLYNQRLIDLAIQEHQKFISALPEKITASLCAFCGQIGDTWSLLTPELFVGSQLSERAPKVWACAPCHESVATVATPVISDRCAHIASEIRASNQKVLEGFIRIACSTPSDEIAICAHNNRRVFLHGRLKVLDRGGIAAVPASWRTLILKGGVEAVSGLVLPERNRPTHDIKGVSQPPIPAKKDVKPRRQNTVPQSRSRQRSSQLAA